MRDLERSLRSISPYSGLRYLDRRSCRTPFLRTSGVLGLYLREAPPDVEDLLEEGGLRSYPVRSITSILD